MKVIGFLNSGSPIPFANYFEVFKQGLEDNGYVEGKNVEIVPGWAEGHFEKLKSLATELVGRGVDVIAAAGGVVSAQPAAEATANIPIVFLGGFSPAHIEFVKGKKGVPRNVTGVSTHTTESVPQRLARLLELVPGAKNKVATLLRPGTSVFEREKQQAAQAHLEVVEASTNSQSDLQKAFDLAVAKGAKALIVCADPSFTSERRTIVDLAKHHQLPTAYSFREYPEAGGLMSYGPSLRKAYRQVGDYVGRILNGTDLSNLPVVEVPISDFELVINGTIAKALGLALTPERCAGAQILGED